MIACLAAGMNLQIGANQALYRRFVGVLAIGTHEDGAGAISCAGAVGSLINRLNG